MTGIGSMQCGLKHESECRLCIKINQFKIFLVTFFDMTLLIK